MQATIPRTTHLSAAAYLCELHRALDSVDERQIAAFAGRIAAAWARGGKVLVFGNGGSASTASHFASDLARSTGAEHGAGVRVICLTDNLALLSALANDLCYADVFRAQLAACAQPGDLVVPISGSGRSPNMIAAAEWAHGHGFEIVALTGFDGGELAAAASLHLHVDCRHYGPIEDVHLAIGHMVCDLLRARRPTAAAGR